jgi:hypothetical protein
MDWHDTYSLLGDVTNLVIRAISAQFLFGLSRRVRTAQ